LDNFVQYTQVRSVRNFTRLGFDIVDVDPELHARLKARLHASLETAKTEGEVQGIYGDLLPKMVPHGVKDLLAQLQPVMEAWTPACVAPSSEARARGRCAL
jgi:hypothetical protein